MLEEQHEVEEKQWKKDSPKSLVHVDSASIKTMKEKEKDDVKLKDLHFSSNSTADSNESCRNRV